jgi:SOS-response transcriptional repressor LexA
MLITITTMVNYWDRLKPEMDANGMDLTRFADAMGISYQAVRKVRDGGSFGKDNNLKAARLFGLNSDWLASGKGPKKASDVGNVEAARQSAGKVPVINWVQAGAWQDIADTFQPEDAERHLPIFRAHSDQTYALRVRGDSMTSPYGRSYPEGCYVIVDPAKRSPMNGDRIIAITPGSKEATFKVYKDEDGRRWLAPLNPTHPTIQEPFEVLGTVIGKWEDE